MTTTRTTPPQTIPQAEWEKKMYEFQTLYATANLHQRQQFMGNFSVLQYTKESLPYDPNNPLQESINN
jgi:hypothetical protein